MKKLFLLFPLIFCSFALQIKSQDAITSHTDWIRIESADKDFSVNLPKNYTGFFDNEVGRYTNPKNPLKPFEFKNLRSFTAFQDRVSLWLESYDVKDAQFALDAMVSENDLQNYKITRFSFEGFSALRYESKNGFPPRFYFANKSRIYLLGYGARDNQNPLIVRFLSSLRLNGKPFFTVPNLQVDNSPTVLNIEDLQPTSIDVSYQEENNKTKDNKSGVNSNNQAAANIVAQNNAQLTAASSPPNSDAKGLMLLWKPKAVYSEKARKKETQGIVRLRVFFANNGQIQKITVVKSLSNGLTENAINAARRLRFLPAEVNNQPVSVSKQVEYSFSIY